MSNKQQQKSNLVDIVFDVKSLGADMNDTRIFGIEVKQIKKGKLGGKCEREVKEALEDAGKCD